MESTVNTVDDSSANKTVPESSTKDSATRVIRDDGEMDSEDSSFGGSECNRCEHIEQEFKVLKGSIKKLIVDIREQMNTSENPFINIQQMMPAQMPIIKDDPVSEDQPEQCTHESSSPARKQESATPEKNSSNDNHDNLASRNDERRCPLTDGQDPATAQGSPADGYYDNDIMYQIIQLLYELLNRDNGDLCRGCPRYGQQPERNAARRIPSGCPAGFSTMQPRSRFTDRGHGTWRPGQFLPCSPQYAACRQENPARSSCDGRYAQCPYLRCPEQDEPQMRMHTAYDRSHNSFDEPCDRFSPCYHSDYAGNDWYEPAPARGRRERNGPSGCDRGMRYSDFSQRYTGEPYTGRPVQYQQVRESYPDMETPQDYYDDESYYDSRDSFERSGCWQGKARRRSLVREPDDSYLQPEPEPVVIDIPRPKSGRGKRKSSPRIIPDMVVVDVEPENVVPRSARISRRKGL